MNTINLDEKIALAKELELENQAKQLEYKKGDLDLKFKEITIEQIRKRLTFKRWNIREMDLVSFFIISVLPPIILFPALIVKNIQIIGGLLVFISFQLLLLIISARQKTSIQTRTLNLFREEIPYGSMLAIKEAKDKGITDFNVWYPTWEEKAATDPIITGVTPMGKMIEIYAWNENDVYEK